MLLHALVMSPASAPAGAALLPGCSAEGGGGAGLGGAGTARSAQGRLKQYTMPSRRASASEVCCHTTTTRASPARVSQIRHPQAQKFCHGQLGSDHVHEMCLSDTALSKLHIQWNAL